MQFLYIPYEFLNSLVWEYRYHKHLYFGHFQPVITKPCQDTDTSDKLHHILQGLYEIQNVLQSLKCLSN